MTSERPKEKKAAWITWETQVRNRSMAAALNAPLYEFTSNLPRLLKYPVLIFRTLNIILKDRIDILFVQNPSIVLSFFAVCVKSILRITVIVDAHNSGIFPLEGRSRILNRMTKFIVRRSDYTIITNQYLADVVTSWGGNPLVMPDPLPKLHHLKSKSPPPTKPYVFFICTWADDEPYMEVIGSAKKIYSDIDIYITGNYRKKLSIQQKEHLPHNVKLLGFVPETAYVDLLSNSIGAIDLTTRDNCLVCGAYEALSMEVPAIISDTPINREIFSSGFIYTMNHADAIALAIDTLCIKQLELKVAVAEMKLLHAENTNQKIYMLNDTILHGALVNSANEAKE